MDSDEKLVKEFIQNHKLAVLATVSSNHLPQAAVMGFVMNDKFEVFVGTYKDSRKHQNLQLAPQVALVIGWEAGKTVQYFGNAQMLESKELEAIKADFLGQIPTLAKYVPQNEAVYYKISPKDIVYTDYTVDPWHRIELRF